MKKGLLIIDIQNDYFPEGGYPLWNTEATLMGIVKAIEKAKKDDVAIILIQHIADSKLGIAPFFNEATDGAAIHKTIIEAAPDAPVVVKKYADSFHQTQLEQTLTELCVTELYICGMMTQNCVTHTAISKQAEKYHVSILQDCCTSVDEMIHLIALNAVSTRIDVTTSSEIFTEYNSDLQIP